MFSILPPPSNLHPAPYKCSMRSGELSRSPFLLSFHFSSHPPSSVRFWLDLELVDDSFFSNPINRYDHLRRILKQKALILMYGSIYQVASLCSGFTRASPRFKPSPCRRGLRYSDGLAQFLASVFFPFFFTVQNLSSFGFFLPFGRKKKYCFNSPQR